MKRYIAFLLVLIMVFSLCMVPVSATETASEVVELTPVVKTPLFTETFESYATDINWAENIDENGFVKTATADGTSTGVTLGDWTIAGVSAGATVQVIDGTTASTSRSSKVLKISSPANGTDKIIVRRNVNSGEGIDVHNGKKVVYEAQISVTGYAKRNDRESFILSYSGTETPNPGAGTPGVISKSATNGDQYYTALSSSSGVAWYAWSPNTTSDWATDLKRRWLSAKYIVDVSGTPAENTHSDTYRSFFAGSLKTATYGEPNITNFGNYPYASGDTVYDFFGGWQRPAQTNGVNYGSKFYGIAFAETAYSGAARTHYVDDITAYTIDALKMGTVVNADDYVLGDTIEIPFNSIIPAASLSYISLSDADGNVIDGGIVDAVVENNAENTMSTIKFKLANVYENNSYKIAITPLFVDQYNQSFISNNQNYEIDVNVIPEPDIVLTPVTKTELFTEDFQSYATDINWAENIDENGFVKAATADGTSTGVTLGDWTISGVTTGATVQVVDASGFTSNKARSSKVLKIASPANSTDTISVRRNVDGNNGMDVHNGKKIIYEGKVVVDRAGRNDWTSSILGYSSGSAPAVSVARPGIIAQSYNWNIAISSSTGNAHYGNYYVDNGWADIANMWQTAKYIVDVSKTPSTTHSDSYRAIYRSAARSMTQTIAAAEDTPENYSYEIGDITYDFFGVNNRPKTSASVNFGSKFYGVASTEQAKNGAARSHYIDDLTAYTIDALQIGTIKNAEKYDPATKITIPFNSVIPTTSLDYIKVYDAEGNEFTDATKEIVAGNAEGTMSTIEISMPTAVDKATYTIKILPLFVDQYSQSFTTNNKPYEIPVKVVVPIYSTLSEAVVSGSTVSVGITLNNPESAPIDMWYIIAAYGEFNEMLGSYSAKVEGVSPDVQSEEIPVEFTCEPGTIQRVKVFVWDDYKTMVPYQSAVVIYGE